MIRHQVSFLGRAMFALLFILAGISKLSTHDFKTGSSPAVEYTAPKLDNFLLKVEKSAGVQLNVSKALYPHLVILAAVSELAGGVLFALDVRFGAYILIAFLTVVTPIMHNFWELPQGSAAFEVDMFMFMKNVSLMGALIMYLAYTSSTKRTVGAAKKTN